MPSREEPGGNSGEVFALDIPFYRTPNEQPLAERQRKCPWESPSEPTASEFRLSEAAHITRNWPVPREFVTPVC